MTYEDGEVVKRICWLLRADMEVAISPWSQGNIRVIVCKRNWPAPISDVTTNRLLTSLTRACEEVSDLMTLPERDF